MEFPWKTNNSKDYWNAHARRERTEGRFTRNVADLKEVLCQGSQNASFRSALIPCCVSTGGQETTGSCSNQASHAGSGYSFYKPRADLWKTLKAWEISLIAEEMRKWNRPPFKRLMSSISPEKRPLSPLWKPRVTSPPDPCTSPFLCCSQFRGFLPLQMSPFHSQSSLTLLFARFHCQVKEGPWEAWSEEARALCSWPGGPIHAARRKFYIPFSNPDAGPLGQAKFSPQTMLSALNTAHRLARQGNCGHFFLCRAGFSLMLCIKAMQCG